MQPADINPHVVSGQSSLFPPTLSLPPSVSPHSTPPSDLGDQLFRSALAGGSPCSPWAEPHDVTPSASGDRAIASPPGEKNLVGARNRSVVLRYMPRGWKKDGEGRGGARRGCTVDQGSRDRLPHPRRTLGWVPRSREKLLQKVPSSGRNAGTRWRGEEHGRHQWAVVERVFLVRARALMYVSLPSLVQLS